MKILATSDIHGGGSGGKGVVNGKYDYDEGILPIFEECDVAIIAGDLCPVMGSHLVEDQFDWMLGSFIPYLDHVEKTAKKIIFVAGNHDFVLESPLKKYIVKSLPDNVTYLQDSGVTIEGKTFYGFPWTPGLPGWAFQANGREAAAIFDKMPENLDVLITHGPPAEFGDQTSHSHAGSVELQKAIYKKKPHNIVCGHIHESAGYYRTDRINVWNVAYLNRDYRRANFPVEITI